MSKLKKTIFNKCREVVAVKIQGLRETQAALMESVGTESKSTAGDKHETGRAMMQLEIEKLGNQLKEAEAQRNFLDKIEPSKVSKVISAGSLIETDKGYLFMALGLGKITVNDEPVFVISPESPLGKALHGKRPGDSAEINGLVYKVKSII